jgi:hypothetical protein
VGNNPSDNNSSFLSSEETTQNQKSVAQVNAIAKKAEADHNKFKNDSDTLKVKMSNLSSYMDTLNKKVQHLNDKCADIIKSLCVGCNSNRVLVSNDYTPNLCGACNSILCNECSKNSNCMKCNKKVCVKHCIKCQVCNKRSCKDKNCIYGFRICQICECTFCQKHFEMHKEFNNAKLFNVKCDSSKCEILLPLEAKAFDYFTNFLMHSRSIKELILSIAMT